MIVNCGVFGYSINERKKKKYTHKFIQILFYIINL